MSTWSARLRGFLRGGGDPTATGAPYLRDGVNVSRYYGAFLLGASAAALGAIYFFGWQTVAVLGVALLAAAGVELLFAWGLKRPLITEEVWLIALIYGLLLPPNLSLGLVALGAVAAMLSRALFGGLGRYLFHPALVGKAFLIVLFPQAMNRWAEPFFGGWGGFLRWAPEAATSMTPLIEAHQQGGISVSLGKLFLGAVPGPLGATSGLLLLIVGLWLLMSRAVDWRISVVFLATVGVGEALLEMFAPTVFRGGWGVHLLSGGLLFTAFLVAPDPITSPMTLRGKWLYALFLGMLVLVLRGPASDPEGVTFSVLVANAFVPLIDKWTVPRSFGGRR